MNDVHAGDRALNPVLKGLTGAYIAPQKRTEERLRAFLKPKLKALQPRDGESKTRYHARVMGAFSGPRWALVRRSIAKDFTDVNADIIGRINDALEQAFVDGFNDAAYFLARSGCEMWPITLAIVGMLAGVILLNRRRMKKKADIQYNEQRTQSAIAGALARDVAVEDLPKDVSQRMSHARQNEMVSSARVAVYGASDYGAYMAGLEAEKDGIELEKTWLSIMDLRVRPSHKGLHGDTIPLHKKFHGLYGDLRYPHDPDAPPQEICRCRCRMVVHIAGRSPGTYSRFLMPWETTDYRKWRDRQILKAGGEIELARLHKRLMG